MLKIVTLMENKASKNKTLVSEHGLSFYIEFNGKNYLFDCGPTGHFIDNAQKLNIDLSSLDAVIISHSHYDHGGGYLELLEKGIKPGILYTGKNFFQKKYNSTDNIKYTDMSAGFDEKTLEKYNIKNIQCSGITEIQKDMYIVTDFEKTSDFEKIPDKFVKENQHEICSDDFSDEVCIVFDTYKGLVVLVGCSHPGIINMLNTAKKYFNKSIYALYGGTHLMDADEDRIHTTIDVLKDMGVEILGLCHCTGENAENIISQDENIKSCHLAVGDTVFI